MMVFRRTLYPRELRKSRRGTHDGISVTEKQTCLEESNWGTPELWIELQ